MSDSPPRNPGLRALPIGYAVVMLAVFAALGTLAFFTTGITVTSIAVMVIFAIMFDMRRIVRLLYAIAWPATPRHEAFLQAAHDGLRAAKARMILQGRPADAPLAARLEFDLANAPFDPPVKITGAMTDAEARIAARCIGKAVAGRLSARERTRVAFGAFGCFLDLSEPVVSNHLLLETRARMNGEATS